MGGASAQVRAGDARRARTPAQRLDHLLLKIGAIERSTHLANYAEKQPGVAWRFGVYERGAAGLLPVGRTSRGVSVIAPRVSREPWSPRWRRRCLACLVRSEELKRGEQLLRGSGVLASRLRRIGQHWGPPNRRLQRTPLRGAAEPLSRWADTTAEEWKS